MPAFCLAALAAIVLSGSIVMLAVLAAIREQARHAAAGRRLLPKIEALQDCARDLLALGNDVGASAVGRPELREACRRLTAAGGRFAQCPALETLRGSEAGAVLDRLELALDDLSASAWICASSPVRQSPNLGALACSAAAMLRLCGQIERRLRTDFADARDERRRSATVPGRGDERFVLAAMRRLTGHPHPPGLGRGL